MTDIQQILSETQSLGATLVVVDGKLKVRPPGVLPATLKATIRERAPEIKAALCATEAIDRDSDELFPEGAAPPPPSAVLVIPPEPAPNAQPEPEPQQAATPPALPLDLVAVIDAIRAAPRSPIETDLVCGRMARVAVELAHLLAELPPLAHAKALVLCRDASQLTAQAIHARNYLQAYALVDSLPGCIRALRPQ